MKPLLSVSQLNYHVGVKVLLKSISFTINSGELVGIIGPNGAGKSTLMKCISGFQSYVQGSIEIQGKSLASLSHIERALCMSYLPQYSEAAFPFNVMETIAFGFHAKQQKITMSSTEIDVKSRAALEKVGIAHLHKRNVTDLSGGEKQLVHFARTLVQDTPLMLLDEPTASLDIGHESQLMNVLYQECQKGKSALVAIHNLNTAAEFCDRLILINHGEIMAEGKPNDVLNEENIRTLYQDLVMVSHHAVTGNTLVSPYKK
ncbi:ATP-binding cassette domain-containing protein [Aliivibrio fischeri]|uniref:ABC transporter ATP-binding protein n=1 Tax=Aliivibrio fischeri TaxID=668 RepID=UPI0012D89AED|nr:ABC transporter ATP-binding protein [Aliivibrio fischeri]MUK61809.1 ATP-binding cassette domain-containing protein [Aliivibrio fischeri]MUK69241.1 ATP-binding cassette domain-containing protein [Aliivibrio fischeri]MUK71723.1 ATP-binding cassette domain-containing protein [Aliivibrio fischeri]MUL21920.1 ATP-binding cassette domain-containing protein [Aliivibrio fischeri]MUL25865.1 ATP-binding cassette domain-containing protein [Aliivibrio fischeri]